VVICEWCGPNAIWYSENKRPGSRLIVRLHRFELYARYPYRVKIRAVDQVVTVDKYYAELTAERTGWPTRKIVALPNTVEAGQLDRPKLDGARFNLGLVGIVPSRKRVDLALDVLEELRRDDERYMLYVKSGMPWDHWWIWQKPEERGHYAAALHRIQRSRCCAAPSCSTRPARTCPPGCGGSASCCRPATTRAFTSHRPKAWSLGRSR